ncbi:cytochrome P450 CYP82D47-like [Malania oleifera]|uniref:cytochrome P450 CYP82D47-like n=1 Tax=Malania oleifera TaxID=397392 RepID=UPI0025ADA3DD|nr:cytochrome P450 CYP82D47-like [Malania oleifera]XP_057975858.1 cytochrome P450 CYP82D47-like [Malania oleifera]XP_057975859.1 cytochrome P450 CYP82D47-like [Malania oleifera]XP_057975860.1 cytochrome P450 CYP82D47-like [Malania oleifera]
MGSKLRGRFLQLWIQKSRALKGKLQPPEAAGAWPIIGHLHRFNGSSQLPHIALGAMAEKHGPTFTIRLGVHRALVINTWEMAKECFTTNDITVSSRIKFLATEQLTYNYAMFGFSPYGTYWRELRKISSIELLSNRRLELLKHVRALEVKTSIKELYEIWTKRKSESCHRIQVEMKQWFGDLTLNIVVRMVAGKRYFGALGSKEKEAQRFQKALRDFFRLMGLFVVGDAVPCLGWLDMGGDRKTMKKTAEELDSILEGWLEEHHQKKEFAKADGEQDFMDVMLSILEDRTLAGYDACTINKGTCLSMILGGSDTTMVVLTWALSLLLNNPHALKKAQDELDIHVGRERRVDEADISKLVYLQAITKETLRLYPPAPLGGPREFAEDCTIGDYHVKRGTWLMMNLWKIQRDSRVWADPSEFQPERFLTIHKDVDVKGQHFELLPFGAGRRACPGISFGLVVVNLTLASLLQAFDIWSPANGPIDMSETYGMTSVKTTPLEVILAPRLPPTLYEY